MSVVMHIIWPRFDSSRMLHGMRQTDEPNDVRNADRMLWPMCSVAVCRRPVRVECCDAQYASEKCTQ